MIGKVAFFTSTASRLCVPQVARTKSQKKRFSLGVCCANTEFPIILRAPAAAGVSSEMKRWCRREDRRLPCNAWIALGKACGTQSCIIWPGGIEDYPRSCRKPYRMAVAGCQTETWVSDFANPGAQWFTEHLSFVLMCCALYADSRTASYSGCTELQQLFALIISTAADSFYMYYQVVLYLHSKVVAVTSFQVGCKFSAKNRQVDRLI